MKPAQFPTFIGLMRWRFIGTLVPALVLLGWHVVRSVCAMLTLPDPNQLYLPCSGFLDRMPKPHPTARIIESHITPTDSIAAGDVLHASARIKCPRNFGRPVLGFPGSMSSEFLPLYDDGTHGDATAHDGLWEVDMVWRKGNFYYGVGHAKVYLGLREGYDYLDGAEVELKDKEQPAAEDK